MSLQGGGLSPTPGGQALTDASLRGRAAKFVAVVQLFRKYSDRYDLDFLLMAAQGYQESRLDHTARSPVGAIGIMQRRVGS